MVNNLIQIKYVIKKKSDIIGSKKNVEYIEDWLETYEEVKHYLKNNGLLKKSAKGRKKKLVNINLRYYKFEYGFWQIDKIMKMSVPEEVINRLPDSIEKKITWGKLFIEIVEKYFYLYNRMEEWFNHNHDNLFKKCYYTFNPNPYLKSIGYNVMDIPEFKHITRDRGELFRIVYEDTVRRI